MKITNDEYKNLGTPETLGISAYLIGQHLKSNRVINGNTSQKEYDKKENLKNIELEQTV